MQIKHTGIHKKYLIAELIKGNVYQDDKHFELFIAVKGPSGHGVVRLEDGHFFTMSELPNLSYQTVEATVVVGSK